IIELTSGMKLGQNDFCRRLALFGHDFGRNTPSVIDDRDRVVDVDNNVHFCAKASQSLINGIVDNLIDEVMKPINAGRSDVHCWPLPDRFQTLQNFDVFGAVIRLCSRGLALTIAPWILNSFNHSFPPDSSNVDVALPSVFHGILGENKARSLRSIRTEK